MKPLNLPIALLGTLMLSLSLTMASAAPKAELWERWSAHNASSTEIINHEGWSNWLSKFVTLHADGVNRVDYGRVGETERTQLRSYIDFLASLTISDFNRNEQQAYWINLYNALTVDVILEDYPVDSIRDIKSGLFSSGPWGRELISVEGQALTLDDIEHRILRPIWQDPRIHYAVNCASIGCPNLQTQAFTATNTNVLMDKAAREFINHERGATVENGDLLVSSIFDWFVSDFGGNDAGVIEHLRQYAGPELLSSLNGIDRIDDDRYDWNLNDSKTAK